MQQAYFSENNQIAGWTLIGYAAPNNGQTTNFNYGEGVAHNTTSQNSTDVIGFAADNRVTLNNCQAGTVVTTAAATDATAAAHWVVKVSANTSNASDVTFTSVAANTANTAECLALTPSFETIGH